MSDYKQAKELYDYVIKNNGYNKMSLIWTISCVEESLHAYDMDFAITDEEKEKMCSIVINGWLDCEVNIGISRIADLVVENWEDFKDSDDNDELIQELIRDEVCF